jgi:hypothetical protein
MVAQVELQNYLLVGVLRFIYNSTGLATLWVEIKPDRSQQSGVTTMEVYKYDAQKETFAYR